MRQWNRVTKNKNEVIITINVLVQIVLKDSAELILANFDRSNWLLQVTWSKGDQSARFLLLQRDGECQGNLKKNFMHKDWDLWRQKIAKNWTILHKLPPMVKFMIKT